MKRIIAIREEARFVLCKDLQTYFLNKDIKAGLEIPSNSASSYLKSIKHAVVYFQGRPINPKKFCWFLENVN